MLKTLCVSLAFLLVAHAFVENAIKLGLVSKTYPLVFWEALANMKEEELNPEFRTLVILLDHERSGNQHWCCHTGTQTQGKVPVYNDRGEIVAWNMVPCAKLGCCDGFLQVAGHCLDKEGQGHLINALDTVRDRMNPSDVQDLINILKAGSAIGY